MTPTPDTPTPSFRYLSVDIDFWNHRRNQVKIAREYLDQVAELCYAQDIPLRAMMNHHQMLRFLEASKATTVINIDYHSDLADEDCEMFSCGTWLSYVKYRHISHYHWVRSSSFYCGECNPNAPIFRRNGRHMPHLSGWGSVQSTFRRTAPNPATLVNSQCAGVGVVLSPSYSDDELQPVFHAWRKHWEVPYTKGILREHAFGVERPVPRAKLSAISA